MNNDSQLQTIKLLLSECLNHKLNALDVPADVANNIFEDETLINNL